MPFGRDVSLPSDGRGALAVGDEEADVAGGDVAAVLSSMLADVVRWRTGTRIKDSKGKLSLLQYNGVRHAIYT